jgi:hypothetical protein
VEGGNLMSMFGGIQIKQIWIKGDIFEGWILQLNNQFKGQNRKVIMIFNNASSNVVS